MIFYQIFQDILDATECTGTAGSRCRGSLNIVYLFILYMYVIFIVDKQKKSKARIELYG